MTDWRRSELHDRWGPLTHLYGSQCLSWQQLDAAGLASRQMLAARSRRDGRPSVEEVRPVAEGSGRLASSVQPP